MGNAILDPCFSPPSAAGVVVCGADPSTGDAGFALRLTEPLPADAPASSVPSSPWLVRLANGQTCRPFTGTVPVVAGEPARWYCGHAGDRSHGGLVTRIEPGSPWTAVWYPASAGAAPSAPPASAVRPTIVPVTDVWE